MFENRKFDQLNLLIANGAKMDYMRNNHHLQLNITCFHALLTIVLAMLINIF